KIAYITGGSKGIGYGVAEVLLRVGMKVAISGRDLEGVKQAAQRLGSGNNVLAIASDVSKLEDEKNAVQQIISKWGALDVVVANAGVGHVAPIDQISEQHWHQMVDT